MGILIADTYLKININYKHGLKLNASGSQRHVLNIASC
jgi:hypothetical protein